MVPKKDVVHTRSTKQKYYRINIQNPNIYSHIPKITSSTSAKSIVQKCVSNVKPILETRKIRKFKNVSKVPFVPRLSRQEYKAIVWLTRSLFDKKLSENLNINNLNQNLDLKNILQLKKTMSNVAFGKTHNASSFNKMYISMIVHRFYRDNIQKGISLKKILYNYCLKLYSFNSIESNQKYRNKMIESLKQQLLNAYSSKVESVEKRKINIQDALKNRAYLKKRRR